MFYVIIARLGVLKTMLPPIKAIDTIDAKRQAAQELGSTDVVFVEITRFEKQEDAQAYIKFLEHGHHLIHSLAKE